MQGTKTMHDSAVLLSIVASSLQPVLRQQTSVLYFPTPSYCSQLASTICLSLLIHTQ